MASTKQNKRDHKQNKAKKKETELEDIENRLVVARGSGEGRGE